MAAKSIDLTAPPDTIDAVHELLVEVWDGAAHIQPGDRYRFELALVELATNVFKHADPDQLLRCSIVVEAGDDRLAGTIYDSGPPVDIDLSGRAMPDALEESGRGIPLIHLLVDTLSYDRVDDRNRWRIERSARRAA